MSNVIPPELQSSPALQFVQSQGWNFKLSTAPNIELETCPYCKKTGWSHFYLEVRNPDDDQAGRDGMHICHRCNAGGKLYALKSHLGMTVASVSGTKDWAGNQREVDPLPDVDAAHAALLADEDALEYLEVVRGFSRTIIKQQRLGVTDHYFSGVGTSRALVYPYFVNNNCIFVHYRTLPDLRDLSRIPKKFSSPKGWSVPLYNGELLRDGLKEVMMVEGEANVIAALDKGYKEIVGVPGANIKKAEWIDTLDKLELDKIYICYDSDSVGQSAAQELAQRVGINKCYKIVLPAFMVPVRPATSYTDPTLLDGGVKQGKDLNEWFLYGGGTLERLEELKHEAVLFDVRGVSNTNDAIQEFYDDLQGRGTVAPSYISPWPALNKLVGFENGDVIHILAPEKIGKTTLALNLLEHMVDFYGEDGVFICLEMTRARLARKWIAHKAQIQDNIPETAEQAQVLTQRFLNAIPAMQQLVGQREGELYFCKPLYQTADDIYNLIRETVRRYGVKWVVLDNLQLLADTTPKNKNNRFEHISIISKELAKITKELGIKLILILQPHRVAKGEIADSSNVDGSSQVAKDCDCMITAHRKKLGEIKAEDFANAPVMEQPSAYDPRMLLSVGLTRYSAGGYCEVYYDGATSTVKNTPEEDIVARQLVVRQSDMSAQWQTRQTTEVTEEIPS